MMQGTSGIRRWALLGATAAVITALGATQVAADRRAPADRPELPGAVVEAATSQTPTVSGDGRLVAYSGAPLAGDERTSTIWLKDRADGSLVELTPQSTDIRPGNSLWPVVSADGCTVTIITELAYDLFRDDDDGDRWDVYRLLLPVCGGLPGDWELVSASRGSGLEAAAGDNASPLYPPAVSAEGGEVAYTNQFSVAAPELTGVTIVDLSIAIGDPGRTQPVVGTPGSAPDSTFQYVGLREPSISADGLIVAYASDADSSALLATWGTGPQPGAPATSHVYVWDRSNFDRTSNVRRLSNPLTGDNGNSYSPALSGDGQHVAFVSTATSLVAGAVLPLCNPGCTPQVYLFDRALGSLQLASRAPSTDPAAAPVAVDAPASQPTLNASGDELLYVSRATNLFATRSGGAGGPTDGEIVLFVPSTGAVERVSVLADGVSPAPAANSHPRLSASGRVVVFDTLAGAAFGIPAAGRQVAIVDHPPVLELAALNVGTVAVGFPGPEWFLVLNNRGPSSFVPATVVVSNPDFLISGGSCADQARTPVPPGSSCTVNLMLMPSVAGEITSTLTVAEDGFGATSITSELTGLGGDPSLAPAPGGGYGGSLVVGTRGEPVPFALFNVAFNPVKMGKLKVSGSNPDDFQVNLDECSGKNLDAGASCDLQVIFTPTAAGRRTAQIVAVTADGVYTTILISGDGRYEPKLAVGNTMAIAGTRLTVAGAGFSPNTAVTLTWSDGSGRPLSVITDANGSLLAVLLVRPGERAGVRTLVAQTADGQVAGADVQIVVQATRGGPSSPSWPSR